MSAGEEIEVALLDQARLLVADRQSGDLVLHFKTVEGIDHYFGVTLKGGIDLIARWVQDVRQIYEAVQTGAEITGEVETPPPAALN